MAFTISKIKYMGRIGELKEKSILTVAGKECLKQ